MSRFDLYRRLAAFLNRHGPNSLTGSVVAPPTRKQLKRLRPPRYKSFFTMGYRGWPKTYAKRGARPAPTIDQVRRRERKYGQRIHVKNGLMFFATDSLMWTAEEAKRRQANCHG